MSRKLGGKHVNKRSVESDIIAADKAMNVSIARNRHYGMLGAEICGCCGEVVGSITYPHINRHGYDDKAAFYNDYPKRFAVRGTPIGGNVKPNNGVEAVISGTGSPS